MVIAALAGAAARILPRVGPKLISAAQKGLPALRKAGSGIMNKAGAIAGKTTQAFKERPIRSFISVAAGVSAAKSVSSLIAPKPPPVKQPTQPRVTPEGIGTGAVIGAGALLGGAALASRNKTLAGKIPTLVNAVDFAQKNPALVAAGLGAATLGGAALLSRRKKKKSSKRRRKKTRRASSTRRTRRRRVTRRARSNGNRVSFTTRDGRRVSFTPKARRTSSLRYRRKRGRRGTGVSRTELRSLKALLRRSERD